MRTLGLIGNIIIGVVVIFAVNHEFSRGYHSASWGENLSIAAILLLICINIINHIKFYKSENEFPFRLNWLALYLKRKTIEEQIKMLEAQKKVKGLQGD